MPRSIFSEIDKITGAGWVDKTLDQLLTKQTINWFKGT
jgi:hypothetical protein